jgi:hypothetical protein
MRQCHHHGATHHLSPSIYAEDSVLFMEHDLEKERNLKLILSAFQQLLGLKINIHMSFVLLGEAQDVTDQYAEIFGYRQDQFPIMFLGILIHYGVSQMLNGNMLRRGYKRIK